MEDRTVAVTLRYDAGPGHRPFACAMHMERVSHIMVS